MTIFEGTTKAGQTKEVRHTDRGYEVWIGGKLHTTGRPAMLTDDDRKSTYAQAPRDAVMAINTALFLAHEAAVIMAAYHRIEAEATAAEEARLAATVPGLDLLKAAVDEHDRYERGITRMMENESNDGARPPARPKTDLDALRSQYPRAAMWLRADSQSSAANHRKASAGDRARELIEAGGDLEEARGILEGWLTESARWA